MRSIFHYWSLRAVPVMVLSMSTLMAADIPVTTVNDSGAGSLRQGLATAASGDRLTFDTLSNPSTLTTGNPLIFSQPVTLLNTTAITLTDSHAFSLAVPLTINWAGTLNLNGNLSNGAGTGSIISTGTGILALSGTNNYTGGTVFEGGTLQLLSNSAIGSGTLTANNFIGNPTLQLADGVQLSNAVSLHSGLVVNAANGTTSQISGIISESGGSFGLNLIGNGTLILSGANTFSGGVYITNSGTLRAENNTALGSGTVSVSGALTLDLANGVNVGNNIHLGNNFTTNVDSGTATLSGTIDQVGPSGMTKTGAGTLIFDGVQSYTGLTSINAGTLQVRDTMSSNVLISSSGTLSGSGGVGNVTNNGIVQPGNGAIGDLTVNGNFTQNAGGTTSIGLISGGTTPGVNNDHLSVTGTATLGGTLNVFATGGGTFSTTTPYTILNATGGVSGQYAQVNSNLSFYSVVPVYDPNDVMIQLTRTSSLGAIATTTNQSSVGTALDNIALTSSGSLFTMINTLGSLSTGQQQQALNQLSGEMFASTQTIGLETGDQFQQRMTTRLISNGQFLSGGRLNSQVVNDTDVRGQSPTSSSAGWIQGFGVAGNLRSDGNGAGVNYSQGGALYGIDLGGDESGVIGITGGNSYVGFHDGFSAGGQLTSYQVGLYGLKHNDEAYILGTTNFGYDNFSTNRNISEIGLTQTLRGNYVGYQFGSNIEAGMKLYAGWFQFQPFVGMQYLYLAQQGFSESGGPAALNVSANQANSLRSNLGGRLVSPPVIGRWGEVWIGYTQVRWVEELLGNDQIINASFNGAPIGGTFTAHGTQVGPNYGLFGKGLQVQLTENWSLFGNVDLLAGTRITTETGSAGVTYVW